MSVVQLAESPRPLTELSTPSLMWPGPIGLQLETYTKLRTGSHAKAATENGSTAICIFSVRLYQLFKALKIKGFYEATCAAETKPSSEDKDWIAEKFAELAAVGITVENKAGADASVDGWFSKYVKKNKTKEPVDYNFQSFEAEHGMTLPPSYKTFMSTVGPKTYNDVDEDEGADARVLAPAEMDFTFYRLGTLEVEEDDEEGAAVDGVMFADTGYGDCFCFDLAQPGPEYPILRYLHEGNYYEPYAEDFMTCVKRFSGG